MSMSNWPWIIPSPIGSKNFILNKFYGIFYNFFGLFFLLINNLACEFMSVLWYYHQKEDQNSD